MTKLDVFNQEGKVVSHLEVPTDLMTAKPRKALLWEMLKMQRASRRQGSASTKTRSRVVGSTKKIYRQKGTGNARHGDIKAPIFVGGGQTFGPLPRDYSYRLPRSARQEALKSVISYKYQQGQLKVLEDFRLKEIKTKKALELFQKLGTEKALLVIEAKDDAVEKSVRNLPHHKVLRVEGMNVYDVLRYEYLLITQGALEKIKAHLQ